MLAVNEYGVTLIDHADVLEITDEGVRYGMAGKEILKKADAIYYAVGMKSNNELYYQIADKAPFVDIIGDAAQIARIGEAVAGGYFAAMDIGTF